MIRLRLSACLAVALASVGLASACMAQIAEPIPQRRGVLAKPMKPEPLRDAMLPCPQYGPGFFRQPGGTTCISVSGQIRGEVGIRQRRSRLNDTTSFNSRARMTLDSRTPTDIGTLRLVFRAQGGAGDLYRQGR
ncbi:MAG: porin [Bosea sp. (in: a-proteobacteria)]